MSRIRFGFRTVRVKTYDLKKFNITKEEAESFAVDYDGFDIWNSDKTLTVEIPQIEKRVKYFHIMFIPFFPVEVHWTTRNKNGLFNINALCEQKVKSVYPKSYGPWYSFLAPILLIASILGYGLVETIGKKVQRNKNANRIENTRQRLVKELDSIATPYYLVIKTSYKYSNSFQRVDSIRKNYFYISSLPHQVDTLKTGSLDFSYHNFFKRFKLNSSVISRDSIHSIIPKSIDENSYQNKNYKLRRIISISELNKPNLEFTFVLSGLIIKNLGKPVSLVDFNNKSEEKDKWTVKTNEFINTNESVRATYNPSKNSTDESNLIFVFSDEESFYEYEVKGTYKHTNSYRAFIDKSVKLNE